MIITIMEKGKEDSKDIKVNREQKIADTLEILKREELIFRGEEEGEFVVYSQRRRTFIETDCSYKMAEIFNGDILEIDRKRRTKECRMK